MVVMNGEEKVIKMRRRRIVKVKRKRRRTWGPYCIAGDVSLRKQVLAAQSERGLACNRLLIALMPAIMGMI